MTYLIKVDEPSLDILRIPTTGAVQLANPAGDKPGDRPPFADHPPM